MKARALIVDASFGPEALKAMGEAFDQAWARVAPIFGNMPHEVEVEAARLRLAEAVLSAANEGSTDVEALTTNALDVMAKHYSSRIRRQ